MSASIYYRRVSKKDPYLPVNAPSSFIDSLERVFGGFPCTLGPSEVRVLRGMAAMRRGEEGYDKLIEVIERFGAVELYASY